jgi:hypothetical protein
MPKSLGGGDERLQGLFSMKPLVGGEPTAARGYVVADRQLTPELRGKLPELSADKAARIRAVDSRKR